MPRGLCSDYRAPSFQFTEPAAHWQGLLNAFSPLTFRDFVTRSSSDGKSSLQGQLVCYHQSSGVVIMRFVRTACCQGYNNFINDSKLNRQSVVYVAGIHIHLLCFAPGRMRQLMTRHWSFTGRIIVALPDAFCGFWLAKVFRKGLHQ